MTMQKHTIFIGFLGIWLLLLCQQIVSIHDTTSLNAPQLMVKNNKNNNRMVTKNTNSKPTYSKTKGFSNHFSSWIAIILYIIIGVSLIALGLILNTNSTTIKTDGTTLENLPLLIKLIIIGIAISLTILVVFIVLFSSISWFYSKKKRKQNNLDKMANKNLVPNGKNDSNDLFRKSVWKYLNTKQKVIQQPKVKNISMEARSTINDFVLSATNSAKLNQIKSVNNNKEIKSSISPLPIITKPNPTFKRESSTIAIKTLVGMSETNMLSNLSTNGSNMSTLSNSVQNSNISNAQNSNLNNDNRKKDSTATSSQLSDASLSVQHSNTEI